MNRYPKSVEWYFLCGKKLVSSETAAKHGFQAFMAQEKINQHERKSDDVDTET